MRAVLGTAGIGAAIALTGCATIVSGTKQTMSFQSTPDGATVTVSGRILGKTPVSMSLEKQKNQTVVFSLDGYKPITMQLTTQMDSWFWGNIVLGGFIGSTTDGVTGSVHMYSPSQYYVTLQPDTKGADGKTSLGPSHQVKDFVVANYGHITSELSTRNQNGEMTAALMKLLAIQTNDASAARIRLAALSDRNPDAVGFASAVVTEFKVATTGK